MRQLRQPLAAVCLAIYVGYSPAWAADTSIQCKADFTLMGMGEINVEVSPGILGALQAKINGVVSNEKVSVEDDVPRPGLNLRTDPYSTEFAKLSSGERSLVHLQGLLDDANTRRMVKIPFEPASVRRIKTYDLIGRTDKFGGRILLEAYGAEGQLLGRALRSILVASCV